MAFDFSRLKNHAGTAAVVAAMLVAALGVTAFFLALRPSRLNFAPGEHLTYRLRTEMTELVDVPGQREPRELPPAVQEQELDLFCVSGDNDLVLLSPTSGRDEVTLLNFSADGATRQLDAASRRGDAGKALGFFDFNLLPLPPGSEQAWSVELAYAALPPTKRNVQGKVKRTRSGSSPEFMLKLPTSVEWVGADNRYMQIRDLTCAYRFNTSRSLVEQATLRLLAGIEREDGRHRFRVRIELTLTAVGRVGDDPRQVRDLALAGSEAQDALASGRRERLAVLSSRILAADVQHPRLRELARRLVQDVRNPQPPRGITPRPLWAVLLAQYPSARRSEADALARALGTIGFRAYVVTTGAAATAQAAVLVGPYVDRDPAVIGALSQRFPQSRANWVRVGP